MVVSRPPSTPSIRADTFGSTTGGSYVVLWEADGSGLAGLFVEGLRDLLLVHDREASRRKDVLLPGRSFYGFFAGDVTLNVQIEPRRRTTRLRPLGRSRASTTRTRAGTRRMRRALPTIRPASGPEARSGTCTSHRGHAPRGRPPAAVSDSASDFTLSAYSGSPEDLGQLDCSDDSLLVQGYPKPHVEFDAKAGVPVYLMVGTSGGTDGGLYYLSVQRPLEVSFPSPRRQPSTRPASYALRAR